MSGLPVRPANGALDPRQCGLLLDANALDANDIYSRRNVERFAKLQRQQEFSVIVPKGVRAETQHPHTPSEVSQNASSQLFTYAVGLNATERVRMQRLQQVMQGNARPGKHDADAEHLFEAGKYGGYFITQDRRILARRDLITELVGPHFRVVTLAEFLDVYDEFIRVRAAITSDRAGIQTQINKPKSYHVRYYQRIPLPPTGVWEMRSPPHLTIKGALEYARCQRVRGRRVLDIIDEHDSVVCGESEIDRWCWTQ